MKPSIEVIAVYYPHWHVYPKGNEWFHPGWTEWEYVRDAKPRFPGHNQPLVPLAGYLDGADPGDVAKEIALASDAGINVFPTSRMSRRAGMRRRAAAATSRIPGGRWSTRTR